MAFRRLYEADEALPRRAELKRDGRVRAELRSPMMHHCI